MKQKTQNIVFVEKKFKRGPKRSSGATFWSISSSTAVRTLQYCLGKEAIQRLLITEIDSRMLKAGSIEKAKELFGFLKNVRKDFSSYSLRKALDKAIRNRDYVTARRLFKQLPNS